MAREALVFSRYLCGGTPPERVIQLYEKMSSGLRGRKDERSLQSLVLTMPFLLYVIDPALALFRPRSVVRRKLHIMFAVLECEPEYASFYLPHPEKNRGAVSLILGGTWSVLRAVPGSLFLLFL